MRPEYPSGIVSYYFLFSQNVRVIYVKTCMGDLDISKPHRHFNRETLKSVVCSLTHSGDVNITVTHESNRRAWRLYTTLSTLCAAIIRFRGSRAFLHGQADKGTQRPGCESNLFRFSYCGRQSHRRFW